MSDNDNDNGHDDNKEIKRTLRERKFIDSYIENNGDAKKAYLTISPDVTPDSAKELGKNMIRKVNLSVKELLNEMGLTDQALNAKLIDGMNTTKMVGKGKDRHEVPDHTIISKYIEIGYKLKAMYPADKAKLELTGRDGLPLMPTTIHLIEKTYSCPLREKGECPLDDKLKELEKPKEAEKLKAMKEVESQKEANEIQKGELEE